MKNSTWVIVGILVVIAILIGTWSLGSKNSPQMAANNAPVHASGGSVYVGVADASANINNVNDVTLAIQKVEIHSATNGWITIAGDTKNFALLSLKASGQTKLYVQKDNIPAGVYDKARVTLGTVVVNTKTKGNVTATTPASELVMNIALTVKDNQSTHLKLDFLTDQSLHTTSDGKFVFTPVVQAESRSGASVMVTSDTENVSGGTVDDDVEVGMDLNGSSRSNFKLSTDNTLKIKSDLGNQIEFTLGGKSFVSDTSKDQENEADAHTQNNAEGNDSLHTTIQGENGSTSSSGTINTQINNLTY